MGECISTPSPLVIRTNHFVQHLDTFISCAHVLKLMNLFSFTVLIVGTVMSFSPFTLLPKMKVLMLSITFIVQ
jgi:hypothetical protein